MRKRPDLSATRATRNPTEMTKKSLTLETNLVEKLEEEAKSLGISFSSYVNFTLSEATKHPVINSRAVMLSRRKNNPT
jgi:hypothetical protein